MDKTFYIPKFYGIRADSYVNKVSRDGLMMHPFIKKVIDAIENQDAEEIKRLCTSFMNPSDIKEASDSIHIARYKDSYIVCAVNDPVIPACAYKLTYADADGAYFEGFMKHLDKKDASKALFFSILHALLRSKCLISWRDDEDPTGILYTSFPDFNETIDEFAFFIDKERSFKAINRDTYETVSQLLEAGLTIHDVLEAYPDDAAAYMFARPLTESEVYDLKRLLRDYKEEQAKTAAKVAKKNK